MSYWDFRDQLADFISKRKVSGDKPAEMVNAAHKSMGLPLGQSTDWVERFLSDLDQGLRKR